jgi:two-component system OmpR family response regulator/two-component system response regulator RstA
MQQSRISTLAHSVSRDNDVSLSQEPQRVLLIEDDVDLATLTAAYLGKQNLDITIEHHGDNALARILEINPQLIVLDVMLPGMDGIEICRRLRQRGDDVPIIMLTARDEDIDEVLGLEMGADDYLAKPVQPRVLLAHIKAILRRIPTSPSHVKKSHLIDNSLIFGQLRINKDARDVTFKDTPIDLTTAEFDLLWLLATNAGRVLSRNEILRDLRGLDYDGFDRSIDSRISRLRRKLGDDALSAVHIKTIRPHGYLFSPSDWL